jgi:hypothetical protein
MKIAKFGLTAVVAVAVITVGMVRLARAAQTVNVDIPVSFTVVNPCNGEPVVFSGTVHEEAHETINGSTAHLEIHFNFQDVSGVGTVTGATYVIPETANLFENVDIPNVFPLNQTINASELVIGQGSVPNFDVHELLHTTINADGTVTSSIDNITATCH